MTGVLIDLRTGDPVLVNGDFVKVENSYAFYQIIDSLLNCQVGTEVFNPYYGFDLETAIKMNGDGVSEMFIQTLLADALDKNKESLIDHIESISCVRDGQEMQCRISVRSIFGEETTVAEVIGG